MEIVNVYTLFHLLGWFLVGRYTGLVPVLFLGFSLGWELLEMHLDYPFAVETFGNKIGDVAANLVGYYCGRYLRNKR